MNGAGKKLWGYYPTNKVWVPIQVDANGKLIIDMSAVNLNDLGDVNIPAPATLDFIYWDDTAGKWVNISYATLLASIQGDTSLDDLADVTIAGLVDGHFLSYSSGLGYWQNRLLAGADIPNLDAAKITSGILAPARVGPKIQDADADTKVDVEESADEDKIRMGVKGVEAFLLDNNGVFTLAKQTSAKGYVSGTCTVPDTTWTKVTYNAEDWDSQGNFDITTNHRFDVTVLGYYLLIFQGNILDMPADSMCIMRPRKNGTTVGDARIMLPFATGARWTGIALIELAVGDYVEVEVYQTSGFLRDLHTGPAHPNFLVVHKIT